MEKQFAAWLWFQGNWSTFLLSEICHATAQITEISYKRKEKILFEAYIAKMKRKHTSSKKPYIELVMRLDTARKLDKMLKGSKQSGKWKFQQFTIPSYGRTSRGKKQ